MKTLLIILLLTVPAAAQTKVSDKNIDKCFKEGGKTAAAFDRCTAEEFNRVREENRYRELRVRAGKDPDGGCGKPGAYKACLNELIVDLNATEQRLSENGGGTPYEPLPRLYYRSYYPRYYFPRFYPRYYLRTYIHPFRTYRFYR